ncbi:MAG: hypothetical protein ACLPTJ_05435 [Solirubrobacteraceae bacterium]
MGSLLMRLAPLTTTGVGSLPFTRPADAACHAVHSYELPFCPQLPRAYGDMLQEWLGADPGRCGWAPDRDRQLPAAWGAFILALHRHPPEHGVVKLQVTGPLTLAMALERRGAGGQADLESLGREISGWLAAAVSDQISALGEIGLSVLVMVDEPGLMAAHRVGAAPAVWDALRSVAPAWGLHVCGEVPWRLLDAAEPDVISYDLVQSGCEPIAQTVIRRLMRRRGRIMWGAIDPALVDAPPRVVDRVRAAVRAVAGRQWRTQDVLSASLVSASCGTGGVSVGAERWVARSIQCVAGLLRGAPEVASALEVPEPTRADLALEPLGGLRGEDRERMAGECTIAAESV